MAFVTRWRKVLSPISLLYLTEVLSAVEALDDHNASMIMNIPSTINLDLFLLIVWNVLWKLEETIKLFSPWQNPLIAGVDETKPHTDLILLLHWRRLQFHYIRRCVCFRSDLCVQQFHIQNYVHVCNNARNANQINTPKLSDKTRDWSKAKIIKQIHFVSKR